MKFRLSTEDEIKAREARAVEHMHSCAPRPPRGGGGCDFDRPIEFVRDGQTHSILMPCGGCKKCRESSLRSETSIMMTEVFTSDWAIFATGTYAGPMTQDEADAEAIEDANDPELSDFDRAWRARNREQRVLRQFDLAQDWLQVDHSREFVRRLNALGQRQGRDAVRAYKRAEIARMVDAAARLWPRRADESKRAYKRRLAEFRREAKAGYMARPDREAVETVIRMKEGFTVRAWVVGQYGEKTDRAHWHLIICGTGAFPKTFPQAKFRGQVKHDFVRLAQWPHGHMQLDYDVNERKARYLARYLHWSRGQVIKVSEEGPEPARSAFVYSPRSGKLVKRPTFKRPRKAGHEYARRLGAQWAELGMMSPDFKVHAPGCRDQRAKYKRGENGLPVMVHNGRASIISGSRARVSILEYMEKRGFGIGDLRREASRRDWFTKERVEKFARFFAEKDRRRNRVAYALDDAERLAGEAERNRPSDRSVAIQSHDIRDEAPKAYPFAQHVRAWELTEGQSPVLSVRLFEAERAAADAEAREASGSRYRSIMETAFRSLKPKVSEGPERQAYLASLDAVRDGRLVYEEGDWIWRGQGPAPWEGLAAPP